ncbi:MAG: class I SAM-dependent methyltransferase [Patescibacteria group bacterium]
MKLINKEANIERENINSFSSELSVKEYSKRYLRAGEEYVIKKFMPVGSRVLDIGCGAGRTTSYISENGCSVVGVDISEPLIKKAKDLYPDIDFRAMDARKLDFKDNVFDTVFFSFNGIDNLAFLEERDRAMNEMKRVLKIGGFLIYSSHNALAIPRTKTSWKIIFNNLGKLRIGPHWRSEEYNFGKLTQYYNNLWNEKARLRALGFKKVEAVGNSAKILKAPDLVLAFLDKFPIYIAQK